MAIDFSKITLEVIDINTNATPDIYINQNAVTFSKRVLEDMGYPQNVQFSTDAANRVFAIRPCKSNEAKATSFSKAKAEQTNTLSIGNRNLREVVTRLVPDYQTSLRYKVTGYWDAENKIMYYDMASAEVSEYRAIKE